LVISTRIYIEAGKCAIFITLRGSVTLTSLIIHTGKCHVGKYVPI
jgi:hypothetical protein